MSENGKARAASKTSDLGSDYPGAFPNSKKVYIEGSRGISVPMREIHLTGDEPPLKVYDTSGPRETDVRNGLQPLREAWVLDREVFETSRVRLASPDLEMPDALSRRTLRGRGSVTQMTYARRGEVTPEMEFVAIREGVEPDFVKDVARC